jgi:hypothetical protein
MSNPLHIGEDDDLDFSVVQHRRREESEEIDRARFRLHRKDADSGAEEPARRRGVLTVLRQRLRRLRQEDSDIYPLW